MLVSVIIPVYNDPEALRTCLECLENQTYPKESYEAIVVDNASQSDIASVVNEFSQALITYEKKPGSYAARNKGISIAKGEIIAFTDADCIPAADWIEKGVEKLMEIDNCGLVAGKVEFFSKQPDRPTAIEFYDMIMFMDQKRYIKRDKFGATANMFTFASVFAQVGLFNEKLKSGGDGEWGKRVFACGYKQIYASDARVKHPARHSLSQLHKKVVRVAGGHYDRDRANMNLGQEILKRLRPPVQFLRWRLSDERLQGNKQKLMFVCVTIFVNYLTAWEMLRLEMGGGAKRS